MQGMIIFIFHKNNHDRLMYSSSFNFNILLKNSRQWFINFNLDSYWLSIYYFTILVDSFAHKYIRILPNSKLHINYYLNICCKRTNIKISATKWSKVGFFLRTLYIIFQLNILFNSCSYRAKLLSIKFNNKYDRLFS